MRGIGGIGGVLLATLVLLAGGEGADAATLKANYQLQGNRGSAVAGAPELVNLGTGNRFVSEAVDGAARQVLTFPKGNGLLLSTAGLVDSASNSVVMLFRLTHLSGFRRILDFSNSTSDNGLYNFGGKIVLYEKGPAAVSRGAVFDDSYAQVVLTNAAGPGGSEETAVYVNGTAQAAAKTSEGFDLRSGVLRFFQDNTSGPAGGEESAGAVACILVYDGALTAAEVGQLGDDPTLCPAPRSVLGKAKALVTGTPRAEKSTRSIAVDTGLTVSCPVGTASCRGIGRVDVVSTRGHAMAGGPKRLGKVRFSVPGGAGGSVVVRLSKRGARALREAGTLKIKVSVEIVVPGGNRATAQQRGRVRAPLSPAFRAGTYSGTTSQDLPILVAVSQTSIRSVYFRWRGRCADGKTHTSSIVLRGERVRRGRFSFGGALETGGSAHISGKIRGAHASGTLSRAGASSFGTKCRAGRIGWNARLTRVEGED
jgi:Concanavalin A-like lectin/glucanases superfamily